MPVERYTLWGWTSRWNATKGGLMPRPLRITLGSLRGCRARERQFKADYPDALTGIYTPSAEPAALILQVQERVNALQET